MSKKILTLILTLIFASNFFSSDVFAATDAEKAAKKEAKLQKKREKELAKAAKQSHFEKVVTWAKAGDVQAQIILAYAYRTGQRVRTTSYKDSDKWKAKAAEKNLNLVKTFIPSEYGKKTVPLPRMFGLAALHAHLRDYPEASDEDAIRWAEMGAFEKDSLSLAYLGSAYYTGRGVQQNFQIAIDYLKKAGDEPIALQLLSDAYEKGNGVEKDSIKSKFYTDYLNLVVNKKKKLG